eukprot:4264656-Amphidinium_carterae.2
MPQRAASASLPASYAAPACTENRVSNPLAFSAALGARRMTRLGEANRRRVRVQACARLQSSGSRRLR